MRLTIQALSKTYANGVNALKDVSLILENGMFGLLGPNGAGKSSLMRTIATLQEADKGTVFLDDLDVLKRKTEVRQLLGYLPQEFGVYPKISAERMLDHIARLKGVANAAERKELVGSLLENVNLSKDRKKHLGTYSGGMKQRFGIAQALIGNPKLIIVDEPTAGLDPEERVRFHNLLADIGQDVIVILSTHIVDDVSDLCPYFAVISKGRVLLTAEPRDAVARLSGKIWRRVVDREELASARSSLPIISTRLQSGRTVVRAYADSAPGPGFDAVEADLEDVYFSAVAGHLAPEPASVAA